MKLEVKNVIAGYGPVTVLWSVDLTVSSGGVVALLGPNGAGKTTLLSVISGLVPVRSGQVILDGADVTRSSPDSRAALGLCHVTEGRSVFPGLTVKENLRLFSAPRQESEGIDRAVSAFPRLGDRLRQVAGTLSGGEQQMLALARAYARSPRIVLLDEVSMGLAPIIVDEIFDFLGRLAAEGTTLLIVEQYISKALALADEASVLVRGRIALSCRSREILLTDLLDKYFAARV